MNNEIDCFNKFVQRVWRSNSAETMMVDRGEEQSESLDEHELQCLVGFQGLSLGPLILWIRQGIRKMSLQCWIIHFRLNLSLTSNAMVLCFPNLILMSQYKVIFNNDSFRQFLSLKCELVSLFIYDEKYNSSCLRLKCLNLIWVLNLQLERCQSMKKPLVAVVFPIAGVGCSFPRNSHHKP